MSKILIVEDDVSLAEIVKRALGQRNYTVDVVTNGLDGLHWLTHENYLAAIIDWELPGLTGVELCNRYRSSGGKAAILMLTGHNSTEDLVEGLDSGADDYLSKPFEMPALLARLRALLRRPDQFKESTYTAGDLEVDGTSGQVRVNGSSIDLTQREFAVLEHLARNLGKICSSESLLKHAWPSESETSPESVRCVINRLKSKLDRAGSKQYSKIRAVYGMGYKMDS